MASKTGLREGAAFTLPDQMGDWNGAPAPVLYKIETWGLFTKVWHYRKGNLVATVGLDYPFRGYHDVRVCYKGGGWAIIEEIRHGGEGPTDRPFMMELQMQKDTGLCGTLCFSTVDEQGYWLDGEGRRPDASGRWPKKSFIGRSLRDRFKWLSAKARSEDQLATYRIQVLAGAHFPLSSADREQVRQFFEEVRRRLWQQLSQQRVSS
jgi:hypothetical protein